MREMKALVCKIGKNNFLFVLFSVVHIPLRMPRAKSRWCLIPCDFTIILYPSRDKGNTTLPTGHTKYLTLDSRHRKTCLCQKIKIWPTVFFSRVNETLLLFRCESSPYKLCTYKNMYIVHVPGYIFVIWTLYTVMYVAN